MARIKSFSVSEQSQNLSNPQSSQVLSALFQEALFKAFFWNNPENNKAYTKAEFTKEWKDVGDYTGLDLSGVTFEKSQAENVTALLNVVKTITDVPKRNATVSKINALRSFGQADRVVILNGSINSRKTDDNGNVTVTPYTTATVAVEYEGTRFAVSCLSDYPPQTPVNLIAGVYFHNTSNEIRFGFSLDLKV